jgi:hypothetical protein
MRGANLSRVPSQAALEFMFYSIVQDLGDVVKGNFVDHLIKKGWILVSGVATLTPLPHAARREGFSRAGLPLLGALFERQGGQPLAALTSVPGSARQ